MSKGVALLVLVLAGALPAAAATPAFDRQSWADELHGWASAGTQVYGTENGGRTWRRILRAGEDVLNVQRTSAGAGFVATERRELITADGGRHWYFASGAGLDGALGRGRFVFWGSSGQTIERLRAWPPSRLRCRTRWIGDPSVVGPGPRPRNICAATFVPLRSRAVYRLRTAPDDELFLAALVPGGVAAFVSSEACGEFCPPLPLRVLVYRNSRGIVRTLPPPPTPASGSAEARILVDWPRLVVTGATGYWVSDDGGDTWRFMG